MVARPFAYQWDDVRQRAKQNTEPAMELYGLHPLSMNQ